jgi:hypothetical protein
MDAKKRRQNEKLFGFWEGSPDGGRRYWHEVPGRHGWKARYIKETDSDENTLRFYQEIYNTQGVLVEVHQKYPVDTGHRKLGQEEGS